MPLAISCWLECLSLERENFEVIEVFASLKWVYLFAAKKAIADLCQPKAEPSYKDTMAVMYTVVSILYRLPS